MEGVNIFTKSALKQAALDYKDAREDIAAWAEITKRANWESFVDLRANFPTADDVGGVVVFNIRHNRYRLLAVVKYAREIDGKHVNGSVFIKAFMSHAQYDRWSVLTPQKREKYLWPRS